MAIGVTFYTFTKRLNSTGQPSGGTTYMCELKDGCSVIAPVIVLNVGNSGDFTAMNYCHIPDFHRYYYITDWVRERGMWIARMSVDVLASNKADIGGAVYYILRSENNYNSKLFDNLATAVGDPNLDLTVLASDWAMSLATGRYVIGVVGHDTNIGATTYYVLTDAQFQALGTFMFSSVDWAGISIVDMVESLQKVVVSPLDYIVSCVWMPFVPPTSATSTVKFGFWDSGIAAGVLSASVFKGFTHSIDIPKHPQYDELGAWTMLPPFTQMSIYLPPFGQFSLDTSKLLGANAKLGWIVNIDCISGQGELHLLYSDDGFESYEVMVGTALVGVTISMAQTYTDVVGLASNTLGALGNVVSGNVGGALSNLVSAWADLIPKTDIRSGAGGFGALAFAPRINTSFLPIVAPNATMAGRPCLKNALPCAGYNIVMHGNPPLACTEGEAAQARAFLEGGFYYE